MQTSEVPSMFMDDYVVGIVRARTVELIRSEQLLYFWRFRNRHGAKPSGRITRRFLQKKVYVFFLETRSATDGVDVFSLRMSDQLHPVEIDQVVLGDPVAEGVENAGANHRCTGRHFQPARRIKAQ